MRLQIILVLSVILVCNGIKVPIDRSEEDVEDEAPTNEPIYVAPTYYVNDDKEANFDSYLIPPDPHKQEALLEKSDKATPASYLLPPTPGQQPEIYFNPTEPEQTDWYPIAQNEPALKKLQNIDQNPNHPENLQEHTRKSKSRDSRVVAVPATFLEPPRIDAANEYFIPPSAEELPLQEIQRPANVPQIIPLEEIRRPINLPQPARYEIPIIVPNKHISVNYRPKPVEASLPLHLIPPQPESYKIPTKLYPKKYGGEFKPVPIPIAQYLDGPALDIPRAKPVKLFKPLSSAEIGHLAPLDEKINYLYQKAEHQRKLKGEQISQEQPAEVLPQYQATYSKYNEPSSTEQEASESSFRHPKHPERNVYPAPLRQASPPQHDSAAPAPNERTEFRMHGMKGPHSYQFGFDTGKGKNRQFRYEERDNEGKVQGHYGYMDRAGKLRVVNYSADPETGFHAEAPVDKEQE